MRLPEFLVGTVHVAAGVFRVRTAAALKPADGCTSGAEGYPQLSAKLTHLINDFLLPNLAPALSQRVAALEDALTPETEELLAKGRRLTEQVGWCTGCYIAVLEAENLSDSRGRCTTDNAPFHLYETLDSCQLRRVHRDLQVSLEAWQNSRGVFHYGAKSVPTVRRNDCMNGVND